MILFNLQVTKDGCPVIFHDNFMCTEENVKPIAACVLHHPAL